MAVRYSKHHGLGNDFLVLLTDSLPLDAVDQAVALCDRRTGIGADGLIYGIAQQGHDISMKLFNCDGSPAAVSGNGLRCLAQAVARQRAMPSLEIDLATPAGIRHCSVSATEHPQTVVVTVDMGAVSQGPTPDVDDLMESVTMELGNHPEASTGIRRWETCDIGNPHVVCEVDDPGEIALGVLGPAIEGHFAEGANVSFVAVSGTDQLTLRVWERGAGITSACGTGATVAAHVFHHWGLIGPKSLVRMPGGDAAVDLSGPLTLTGPATHVADVEVCDV